MIKVNGVYKWYGDILAIKDISFYVDKGDILAFIGSSGAVRIQNTNATLLNLKKVL